MERERKRERKCVRDREIETHTEKERDTERERERERERKREWTITNEGVKREIAKHSKKKNCLIVFSTLIKTFRAFNNC